MKRICSLLLISGAVAFAQRIELGPLAFVPTGNGEWGLQIAAPRLLQPKPAQLEVFRREDDILSLAAAYRSVRRIGDTAIARAELPYGPGVVFRVEDRWSMEDSNLSVHRKVQVSGKAPGGFYSALVLSTAPDTGWHDLNYFAPAALYREPIGDAPSLAFREDCLAAPMLALSFKNGASVAVLDPTPRADTTYEDISAKVATVLLDDRLQFGTFGANAAANGGVEFGYWFPGSLPRLRRYHRIHDGFTQEYTLSFRFGSNEPFPALTRNTWRWAWQTLNPPVNHLDVELVRRTLLDHLADRVVTVEGRSAIPWIFQATTGNTWNRPDDMRAVMGFVGKNIEAADQLLREGDCDASGRGRRMRDLGLSIIESFIRQVPMSPPAGEGFDLLTGEATISLPPTSWRGNLKAGARLFLRAPSEDLTVLVGAYGREKSRGREHPEWLVWSRQFVEWLLPQQRADGSFPRAWSPGTSTVVEPSGSSSYNPVPLLVKLGYLEEATRAAQFVWENYGSKGYFVGGTMDNPDVIDKEAGMLSLEAFLALFEATHDRVWLARAEAAASYAETYLWIWNVPMPVDANDAELHWKKGVPTVGLQGIAARGGGGGGVDEYLDWSTPAYAKLYRYTNDPHYLDVARVLLHNTKAMLALPGRTYDLAGPGWQQENFNLGTRRGFGGHRGWLPWVSVNHLWSITGVEAFDPVLFRELQ